MTSIRHDIASAASAALLSGFVIAAAAPGARADASGMGVLRKMVATYRGLSYSDSYETSEQRGATRRSRTGQARYARPNRYYLTQEEKGTLLLALAGNGKRNIAYSGAAKQYAEVKALRTLPKDLINIDHAPLRFIAGLDLAGAQVADATVTGNARVNGKAVQVLRVVFKVPTPPKGVTLRPEQQKQLDDLRRNPPDVRYYVGVGDNLMYRNEINLKGKTRDGRSVAAVIAQDFRNVRVNGTIPDAAFAFAPPAGTQKVSVPAAAKR
jgi:outer membrane lipoprotein-sorting protein